MPRCLLLFLDVFLNMLHLKTIEGDKAFYYRNLDGDFHGAVLTHVDNFEVTGTNEFVEEIIKVVEKELTISKVEEDKFKYTGVLYIQNCHSVSFAQSQIGHHAGDTS